MRPPDASRKPSVSQYFYYKSTLSINCLLILQREGPGSELGNSLWHPDVSLEAAVLLYRVLGAFSVERVYCIQGIQGH